MAGVFFRSLCSSRFRRALAWLGSDSSRREKRAIRSKTINIPATFEIGVFATSTARALLFFILYFILNVCKSSLIFRIEIYIIIFILVIEIYIIIVSCFLVVLLAFLVDKFHKFFYLYQLGA